MSMFGKKNEEKSPLDALLGTFTKSAKEMNALFGFPGVLLLAGVVAFAMPAFTDLAPVNGLYFLSGCSILASALTYSAQWFYLARQSEAQAKIVSDFTEAFLHRYLSSKEQVDAEHVDWAIKNIIEPLTKDKPRIEKAPNKGLSVGP